MLANDEYGDCVEAGAAHETLLWCDSVGGTVSFTDEDVLSDYSAVTGFSAADPNSDQGTDLQEMAAYRQKTGILDSSGNRHRITAYSSITPGDLTELMAATYVLGAVGIGINVPSSMEQQFTDGEPLTVVPGDTLVGGHYVPVVGRNAAGNLLVVTWGSVAEMTPGFFQEYNDEIVPYISLEYLDKSKVTPENFDMAYLGNFLKELT